MRQAGRGKPEAGKSDLIKKVAPAVGPTSEDETKLDRPMSKGADSD
jgi:hypothetical protein